MTLCLLFSRLAGSVPPGAASLGFNTKTIDLVPTWADIAPAHNADGYALHDVIFYSSASPNRYVFSNDSRGLVIPFGFQLTTQKHNSTQGALPYLPGATGFYVEFHASLSDNNSDHWPALWLMPKEHDLAQSDHYAGDPQWWERWMELDVDEGGFGEGQLCSVIDWQGIWGGNGYYRDYPTNTVPGAVTTNNWPAAGAFDRTQAHVFAASYNPNEGATGVVRWYRDDVLIFQADAPIVARQQHFYMIAGAQSHGGNLAYAMYLKRIRAFI